MQDLRWRKGLSGAKGPERLCLLAAEKIARERAFGEAYQRRCDALGSVLVDAHDLSVDAVKLEWARSNGRLLVILDCYNRSAGRLRTFHWSVPVSRAVGSAFDSVVKSGLKRPPKSVP